MTRVKSDTTKSHRNTMMKSSTQQGIQSLEIGIHLFRCLHRMGRPSTLAELAKASLMHPSKAHRYFVSLIRSGLVRQDGRGLYALGPLAIEMTASKASVGHLRDAAVSVLPSLVAEIGETVFVSVWGQQGPVILAVEEPAKPIVLRPMTKGDLPLHNSATGRVFAAFMDSEKLTRLLNAEFTELGTREKLTKDAVARQRDRAMHVLEDTRKRGLARSINERYPGCVSFSAPIFDARGEVAMALTTFGLSATMASGWDSHAAKALKSFAAELTRQIGGQPK